jgi:hypothetical protein
MSWAEDMGYDAYYGDDMRQKLGLLLDPDEMRLYWTTKSGDHIFIEDMETSHIKNIIQAGIYNRLNLDEHSENRFLLELSLRTPRPQVTTKGIWEND